MGVEGPWGASEEQRNGGSGSPKMTLLPCLFYYILLFKF